MAPNSVDRVIKETDEFYRILKPETWDSQKFNVYETAFQDQYNSLSLFIARMKTPRQVLEWYGTIRPVRKAVFGNPDAQADPGDFWEKGYGIAIINYADIMPLGLDFKIYSGGFAIRTDGHVDLIGGQEWALELSDKAIALPEGKVLA